MLFSRWTDLLHTHSAEIAVHDLANSKTWSFGDLQEAVAATEPLQAGHWHGAPIAQGLVPFLVQTLRAWRDHAVLCPLEKEAQAWPFSTQFPQGIAHLKLTSGSTGQAKCVMMSEAQIAADADQLRATMKLRPEFPNLAVISAAHSYGFSNLVTPLLLQGHPIVAVADALPASLRQAFALPHRYTLPAVPAMWQAWHRLGLLNDAPIHLAISAGAPLAIHLEEQIFQDSQLKIHNFYGSSECGGIAYDDSETPRADASFVGKAVQGVELSIHEDGCLRVSSNAVATGYETALGDEASGLEAGTFRTSDIARLEGDRVHLLGRLSDAINIAGRKLNPQDVEEAITKYHGVKHVVAFGVPSSDPARCEECVAIIHPDAGFEEKGLQEHLGQLLAMWQKPRHLWICPHLAPDLRGKFPRNYWRQQFLQHQS